MAIDDLVQILIFWIRKIHTQAKNDLESYRLEQSEKTDNLVRILHNILINLKHHKKNKDKIKAIESTLKDKTESILQQCETHLGLVDRHHYALWTRKPYHQKRHVILQIIEQLSLHSSYQDDVDLEKAITFIIEHKDDQSEWISINKQTEKPPVSFLSDDWYQAVTGLSRGDKKALKQIHQKYYEIAVLTLLADDLACGDMYVDNAHIFDDPNKQFVSDAGVFPPNCVNIHS